MHVQYEKRGPPDPFFRVKVAISLKTRNLRRLSCNTTLLSRPGLSGGTYLTASKTSIKRSIRRFRVCDSARGADRKVNAYNYNTCNLVVSAVNRGGGGFVLPVYVPVLLLAPLLVLSQGSNLVKSKRRVCVCVTSPPAHPRDIIHHFSTISKVRRTSIETSVVDLFARYTAAESVLETLQVAIRRDVFVLICTVYPEELPGRRARERGRSPLPQLASQS